MPFTLRNISGQNLLIDATVMRPNTVLVSPSYTRCIKDLHCGGLLDVVDSVTNIPTAKDPHYSIVFPSSGGVAVRTSL